MFNSKNLKDISFIFTALVLFVLMFKILTPYLGIILIALILVELFYPWYKFLKKTIKSETLATLISGLSVILTVVIPAVIIGITVLSQANLLLNDVGKFWEGKDIVTEYNHVIARGNDFIANFTSNPEYQITNTEVKDFAIKASQQFLNVIIKTFQSTASNALGIITKVLMLIISIFAFFPLRDKIYSSIKSISPLEDSLNDIFIESFSETAKSIVKGSLAVAFGLGLISGIVLWILGIHAAVFWSLMIVLVSIIPLGPGLILIPFSVYQFIIGEPIKGIILLVTLIVMTNGVDSLIRAKVIKTKSKINPLLLAFTFLGAIEVFGAFGLLYGPLILVFFTSIMEVYQKRYK